MKKGVVLLLLIAITCLYAQAQNPQKDSVVNIISIGIAGGIDFPGADLKDRYGVSNSVGGSFIYKTDKNWILMAEGDYLFGRDVKIYDDVFENIATEDGYVIDEGGIYTDMAVLESGLTANVAFGKLIPLFGPNENSGIVITVGAGYIFHKIRIEQTENSAPQLTDEYVKGYDRLTEGFNISEFIGYHYYGNNNISNFYLGFEFHQAFTSPSRVYNFDQMEYTSGETFDLLSGFKFGWIIPLGKQTGRNIYYY